MPEEEITEDTPTTGEEAVSKLGALLESVTSVDQETGKQASPWAVLIGVLLIALLISGVGIAVALTKRKAVKAQYELDKLKEEQDRKAAAATQAELEAERNALLFEVDQLEAKIDESKELVETTRADLANELKRLDGVTSWDDLEVRRAP